MVRGTTPTFTLTVRDRSDPETVVDLEAADHVYFTIEQGSVQITKTGSDLELEDNTAACWLTQTDSLSLAEGKAEIQLNWTYDSGRRAGTDPKTIYITRQLLDQVVS